MKEHVPAESFAMPRSLAGQRGAEQLRPGGSPTQRVKMTRMLAPGGTSLAYGPHLQNLRKRVKVDGGRAGIIGLYSSCTRGM